MSGAPSSLFDKRLGGQRLDRALKAPRRADFLLARAAEELADRLALPRRFFPLAADIGTPGPHGALALLDAGNVGRVVRVAPTRAALGEGAFLAAIADLERLPIREEGLDLIVSLFALHAANDLPGALIQMRRSLKPGGLLIGALSGGETLRELRQSLLAAESEATGGAAPRVHPTIDVRALGALLQRAGFALPVVDLERAVVRYDNAIALMRDLRAMGATNALNQRTRRPLRRETLFAAAAYYAANFSDPDGRVRATFDTLWLSGWAPER